MTYQKQFSNTWGIILGGSSGFGFAALEKLASHGMSIAVLYRETAAGDKTLKETLSRVASTHNVSILPYNINALDASSRAWFLKEFSAAVGKKGVVGLLLHSIARGNLKPLLGEQAVPSGSAAAQAVPSGLAADGAASRTAAQAALSAEDITLTGYAMGTSLLDWSRDLLGEGLFAEGASIIGLTSEGAHKYWDGYAAVSIAKASLESLSTYMAVEFGKYGLRTNLIQAGVTSTPAFNRIPGSKELLGLGASRNPMGRLTTPRDVAGAIYLLCLEEASWINGSLLHVDGGEHCR
jgi:enoyl-[acyl-carrier protein] reductase III